MSYRYPIRLSWKIFLILFSLGLMVSLTGYVVIKRNRVHHLTIAAGSKQGESYIFSQAMAQVVAKYNPKIQIKVLETKGSKANIILLEEKKVQLATAQADIPALPSARIVSKLFPDMFQLVVQANSGINQVSDLKGKRIGLPPEGDGQYLSFLFVAEHYGLKKTDFFGLAVSEKETDEAFRKNKVDAVFRVRPPGNKSILDLVQNRGGRLVPIEQAEAMKIKEPTLDADFIPKGTYQGSPAIPATDLPTVAVPRILLADQKVDYKLIQEITSILYERRRDLAALIPEASYISPPSVLSGTILPIHPGAQAYYDREKPSFLQENADWLGLLLSIAVVIGSWALQLKSQLEKKQKNQGDNYNQEILVLMKHIECCKDLARLEQIRHQLFSTFESVVNALDYDQITPESFQSFTFTWEAAIAAFRDRRSTLMAQPTPISKSQ
ncbi:TAXI family TRAP transporter solute-binding subunit [Coleofasciculus chthonoplastes]|jgi:TRAP transporter TAXI family solute receptor|uniref:TAXI family TRAP transporter solute-binding subunit n=1 Tax=Coleofasciculus chthonoplastes TaxID=64178 RepID=UPI0032FFFBAC